jgi:hypothetical protein
VEAAHARRIVGRQIATAPNAAATTEAAMIAT